MVIFKAKTLMSVVAYITPTHYEYVNFDGMSNGGSMFVCKSYAMAKAIFNTPEFKKGYITSDTKPEDFMPKPVVKPFVASAKPVVTATPVETAQPVEPTGNDGMPVSFPDLSSAVMFLVEKGCKKSDLRSVKAVKEKGEELGYVITIEE